MPETLFLLFAAFLAGGIPFPFLVVKIARGVDVRDHGSGNMGATNASRVFPRRWQLPVFLLIFALDAGKGCLATWLLPRLLGLSGNAPALAGLAAFLGHVFTPYLRFRGGKGVATTLGVMLALEPVATGVAVGIWLVVWGLCRIVAMASLALAVALPAAVYLRDEAPPAVGVLTMILATLILIRHQSNIVSLLKGEET